MSQHIVISGNPVDGFAYWGPFDGDDAAIQWAEVNTDADWWVAPLVHGITVILP